MAASKARKWFGSQEVQSSKLFTQVKHLLSHFTQVEDPTSKKPGLQTQPKGAVPILSDAHFMQNPAEPEQVSQAFEQGLQTLVPSS